MTTHELKCWPSYFRAIRQEQKRFELRKHDRDFAVGDRLLLREYDPTPTEERTGSSPYTGEQLYAWVTYVLPIDGGRVIMSIEVEWPVPSPASKEE